MSTSTITAACPTGTTDHHASRVRNWLTLAHLAWGGLVALAAFPLFGAVADLFSDQRGGIPADHAPTFRVLTGMTLAQANSTAPGIVNYIRQLEVGYAVHEIAFAVLLLAIVAIPLRRRQQWAWFACWTILLADIAYAGTFGAHDPTLLRQALIGAIGMPVLLLAFAPCVFHSRRDEESVELHAGQTRAAGNRSHVRTTARMATGAGAPDQRAGGANRPTWLR
jgi:hypothetical protein